MPDSGGRAGALFWKLFQAGEAMRASDFHLSAGRSPILRVDGRLMVVEGVPPLAAEDVEEIARWILGAERGAAFFTQRKETDVSFAPSSKDLRFRVNLYWSAGRLAMTLRVLPREIPRPAELRIPPVVLRFASARQGLLLITGPSGHGKTTTMASLVDEINRTQSVHIVTIEDPLEYLFTEQRSLIHQREVGPDTPSFGSALRAVLREDPNVVIVGEMRDLETIAAALTVAETGHLVMATLHTNDAPQTIDRIIDVFPAAQQAEVRTMLAGTLLGVVSIRLLPRARGQGRVRAYEVLVATLGVRNLIREGEIEQIPSLIETGREHGMITFARSLEELVTRGEVTVEEAAAYLPPSSEVALGGRGDVLPPGITVA